MKEAPPFVRAWAARKPGQVVGRGHPAGDFLEAYEWRLLEESKGLLRIRAHLPAHVRNPRGQLFGGFTPTYVDLVALFTVRAGERGVEERFRTWLATTNLRVDYFEPIVGPEFVIDSRPAGSTAVRTVLPIRPAGTPSTTGDPHRTALNEPIEATTFVTDLKARMAIALERLEEALTRGNDVDDLGTKNS